MEAVVQLSLADVPWGIDVILIRLPAPLARSHPSPPPLPLHFRRPHPTPPSSPCHWLLRTASDQALRRMQEDLIAALFPEAWLRHGVVSWPNEIIAGGYLPALLSVAARRFLEQVRGRRCCGAECAQARCPWAVVMRVWNGMLM